jgi:phage recombination protein Bet
VTLALAKIEPAPLAEWTPERVQLLKRTICPDLTNDELDLFTAQCRRTGLDPFSRQIYATKRRDNRAGVDKLTLQTGIDGFRLIAARTGELDGQDGPFWCGPDGVWRDVWLEDAPPAAAKVLVYRKGCSRPFTGVARWAEYAQRYKDGNPSGLWGKMPATMLAKCGEALALRKAFPQDLSGLYTSEEMEQADDQPDPPADKPVRGKKALAASAAQQTAAEAVQDAEATPVRAKADEADPVATLRILPPPRRDEGLELGGGDRLAEREVPGDLLRHEDGLARGWRSRTGGNWWTRCTRCRTGRTRRPVQYLQKLLNRYAELTGLTAVEVLRKLGAAAKWPGENDSVDELTDERVAVACESMRKKIDAKAHEAK